MTTIDFVTETLYEAGALARDRYADRTRLHIAQKADLNDLVTEADLAVQRQIVDRIARTFPGDAVLAEESGLGLPPEGRPERCWILDPIDGTQNFVRALFPAWGISLGFVERGSLAAGGVYFPITGDLFLAERGAGARRNGGTLSVSALDHLERARIDYDVSATDYRRPTLDAAPDLFHRVGGIRIHGCAVAALCSVATGDLEAYVHIALNPWDYAAGVLIVEEAGGRASTWSGAPLTFFEGRRSVLASNAALYDQFLPLLKE